MSPRVGAFEHGGRRVAFAAVGSGPLLICDLGRLHHLDVFWLYAPYRRLVEALARDFTVVRFDRPGCGLSDRAGADFSLDAEVTLFSHLLDALRAERAPVLACLSSAPVMIAVAAAHPERVARLALFGAGQRSWQGAFETSEALESLLRLRSPLATEVLARRVASGCSAAAARWLAGAFARSASGEVIAQWLRQSAALDVGADLGRVRCPTLVMQRRGDRLAPFQQARDVAARIPGAVLLPLDGNESIIWEGDAGPLLGALRKFLQGADQGVPRGDEPALTQRQLQIAQLAGHGLTNAEIGHRLGIGRRTVESHLERIRAKLGLLSRTGLAAWMARRRR